VEVVAKEKKKPGFEKGEPWFYDIEPIVANLNEPGVTRYVRVALTLEVGNGMATKEGTEFLDQKKPLLKHWLTLYLSNQTIDGVRGEKNLRQVQTQIADALNQGLFPNGKPRIVGVLFKELSIQ
jgi:flagellar basal body-associated protein FliL